MKNASVLKLVKHGLPMILVTGLVACGAEESPETPSIEPLSEAVSVVLVHGAFADGSAWNKVIPILQEAGASVAAAQLPLTSLADDAAAVTRLIDLQTSPVVLVGHSWGGAVITEAGAHENVESLVYVAAFAPDAGQSIDELLADQPEAPWTEDVIPDAAGKARINAHAMATYFAQDLPAWETAVMTATQGPIAFTTAYDTPTVAAWQTKSTRYIISENDLFIPASLQVEMAADIEAETTTLSSSHVSMLSQPEAVAQVILDAVAEVGAQN